MKPRAPAKQATHPPFKTMIEDAIATLSAGRQKASRQAIQKHIFANHLTVEDNTANRKHINRALARMATSGAITRKSGTGASGSFRPAPKPVKLADEKSKVAKKPSAKKPAGTTKVKSPGKRLTKPATKKPTKPESPGKKPATKKSPAAKKAKEPSAKKPTTKK